MRFNTNICACQWRFAIEDAEHAGMLVRGGANPAHRRTSYDLRLADPLAVGCAAPCLSAKSADEVLLLASSESFVYREG